MLTKQTHPDLTNENWALCEACGEKRLIQPDTGDIEPCANCRSKRSTVGLTLGAFVLLFGMIGMLMLLALGASLIL